jgi:hypothetical protein
MRPIKDYRGKTLKWVRPKMLRRHYELRSESDVYATLTWQTAFGSLAIGECADGKFNFKRGGFLHPYVTVRKMAFDTDYGKLQLDMGYNGVLQFIDARTFQFQKLSIWKMHWGFTDVGKKLLCTVKDTMKGGEVTIDTALRDSPHLAILMILGWYVMVLRKEEAAATAVTMSAAVTGH